MSLLKKVGYAAKHPDVAWRVGKMVGRNKIIEWGQPFLNGKAPLPTLISIEPSNRCNLECQICGRWEMGKNSRRPEEMELSVYEKLLDELKSFRPFISLTGGEPTLYPDIVELVRCLKERGFNCSLVTNGLRLAEIAEVLVRCGLDVLHISVDGAEREHDAIRRRQGAYVQATQGIKDVARWKKKLGQSKPFLQIIQVITDKTFLQIPSFLEECSALPVQSVRIQHLWFATVPMLRHHNALLPDKLCIHRSEASIVSAIAGVDWEKIEPAKLHQILMSVRKGSYPFSVSIFPSLTRDQLETYYRNPEQPIQAHCIDSYVHTVITSNGDVSPCMDYVAGNIQKEPFLKIWNGSAYRFFRGELKAEGGHFPYCTRCCGIFSHKGLP